MSTYNHWESRIGKASKNKREAARLAFIAGLKQARTSLSGITDEDARKEARDILDGLLTREGATRWCDPSLP